MDVKITIILNIYRKVVGMNSQLEKVCPQLDKAYPKYLPKGCRLNSQLEKVCPQFDKVYPELKNDIQCIKT